MFLKSSGQIGIAGLSENDVRDSDPLTKLEDSPAFPARDLPPVGEPEHLLCQRCNAQLVEDVTRDDRICRS